MPRLVPVTPESFAGKAWKRPPAYAFAAREAVVGLTAADLNQAAPMTPLAFVQDKERMIPVVLMAPQPGRNLFVGPKGQWLGTYVPLDLRAYPFRLLVRPAGDAADLYIDEDSGLVCQEGAADSQPFYDASGALSAPLQEVLKFLAEVEGGRMAVLKAAAQLHEAGVIGPWSITVKSETGDQAVEGLYRVEEPALNALDDQAFAALRAAMPLAFAQLLSTAQLPAFARLNQLHATLSRSAAATPAPAAAPAFTITEEDGFLRFD